MRERDSDRQDLGHISTAIAIGMIVISIPLHELGHAIALNLLGIPATLIVEIWDVGPVAGVMSPYLPSTTMELAFVIATGPGLAAIVCAVLGRVWRTECYVAAVFQACYVPFELLTWMLGVQSLNSFLILPLSFMIVILPFIVITDKIFNRLERRKR